MKKNRELLIWAVGFILFVWSLAYGEENKKGLKRDGEIRSLIDEYILGEDHDLFYINPSYFEWVKKNSKSEPIVKSVARKNGEKVLVHIYQLGRSSSNMEWNSDASLLVFDLEQLHPQDEIPSEDEERFLGIILMDSLLDELHH